MPGYIGIDGLAKRLTGGYVGVPTALIENLITDGSFENMPGNWTHWLAEPTDTSQHKDGTRSLKLGGDALAENQTEINVVVGHKYYAREYIKTAGELDAADCRFEINGPTVEGTEAPIVFGWNRGNYPDWTPISTVVDVTSAPATRYKLRTFTVGGTTDAWVDSIVLIDLTEAFGAGNEPTKEWCDANIPFFDGAMLIDYPAAPSVARRLKGIYIGVGDIARRAYPSFGYVSFGDSIAAGHSIDDDWEANYGTRSQYGENGNASTTVVPNSYTDLIRKELSNSYGAVTTASFAHSGDTVADLMNKLTHTKVRNTLKSADIATICIGANDILGHVWPELEPYIYSGDLSSLEAAVNTSLNVLNTDSEANSYKGLLSRLHEINPNAKYAFTTVYNPYKYLYIEPGRNGFFKPALDIIPQMNVDIPYINVTLRIDEYIKDWILSAAPFQTLFSRINGLHSWVETYVTRLNDILKSKVNEFNPTNPNFAVADTKALFDVFPDRPVSAQKHYNDLVNVEFTRGYTTATMDWGALYDAAGKDGATYWYDLITKHLYWKNALPSTNPLDYVDFDAEALAAEVLPQIIEYVIVPNIDPHPETYGQYALMRSFADTLGWSSLDRHTITYHANGGNGSMASQTLVGVDGLPAFTYLRPLGFSAAQGSDGFTGWNTAANGGGSPYSNEQFVGITSDLALYAQWALKYFDVTFRHSEDSTLVGSGDTGNMENYALWIDGVEQSDLGAFSNGARTYRLPYGTQIGVIAQTNSGSARSYVTWNGTKVAGTSSDARYTFNLTCNVDINFEYNYFFDGLTPQKYWNCYITTS